MSSVAAAATSNHKRKATEAEPTRPAGFEAGDRVRCKVRDGPITVGELGTVTGSYNALGYELAFSVQWENRKDALPHFPDRLELVESDPAKKAKAAFAVGDRVIRTAQVLGGRGAAVIVGTHGRVTALETSRTNALVHWEGEANPFESDSAYMTHAPDGVPPAAAAAASLDADPEEIQWLVVPYEKYCDLELVQEAPVRLGFRCTKMDIARLNSDFLTTLLECVRAEKIARATAKLSSIGITHNFIAAVLESVDDEKLTRVTVPPGTFASYITMDHLFGQVIPCWTGELEYATTHRQRVQLLHAANSLGLYACSDIQKTKDQLLTSVGTADGIPLVELFELGVRYHWKEMQEAAARKLQLRSAGDIPDAVLLKCAPYWRT